MKETGTKTRIVPKFRKENGLHNYKKGDTFKLVAPIVSVVALFIFFSGSVRGWFPDKNDNHPPLKPNWKDTSSEKKSSQYPSMQPSKNVPVAVIEENAESVPPPSPTLEELVIPERKIDVPNLVITEKHTKHSSRGKEYPDIKEENKIEKILREPLIPNDPSAWLDR